MPITLKVPRVWIDPDKLSSPKLDDLVLEVYGSYPCEWNGGRSFIEYDGSLIKGGKPYQLYQMGIALATINEMARLNVRAAVDAFNAKGVQIRKQPEVCVFSHPILKRSLISC
ncbi:MAG: hypothetical protein ABH879_01200 [archaeon]